MNAPAYLIDASIYIFRAYFSLPERWFSPGGYPLNAVYGYTGFLLELLSQLPRPATVAAAFDESLGSCFRNEIYPGYKASRELPDEALAFQLQACREITELMGIPCFGGDRHEADDYIATLAARYREAGRPVTVVTRDKDLGQLLLGEDDRLWDFAAGNRLDRAGFRDRFGVAPEQFADYQGLVGDSIDDIPGVPAVGAKSGAILINAFNDLETLEPERGSLDGLGLRGAARISAALEEHWEQALISRELARLDNGTPGVEAPDDLQLDDLAALENALAELGLAGPLTRRVRSLAEAG